MESKVNYSLRDVTRQDCDLLFVWANDKTVRENSFNANEIKYDEHVNWFNNKLDSKGTNMYIFEVNYDDVGLIRLDKLNSNSYLINYSISKEHRGKGYATALLTLIKGKYSTYLLIGKVKQGNIASIKAFTKAGYIMKEEAEMKIFHSLESIV